MNKPSQSPSASIKGMWGPPPAQQAQIKLQQACALHQQGHLQQARTLYEQVLQIQPKNFDALHLLGVLALQSHDCRRAVELITQALKIDRNHAAAYNHRGAAYAELKEFDFAILNHSKAIELQPQLVEAWNNRANVYLARGQFNEALADLDKAVAMHAAYAQAHHNRGNVLSEMGRHQEAIASYQRAVDLNQTGHDMRWSLGMACLRSEEFARGWAYSEGRLAGWANDVWRDTQDSPRWQGEALAGKSILLRSEQGLGDTLQFARYVPLLAAQGAKVILEAQPGVMPLLAKPLSAMPGVSLIQQGQPLPDFDCYSPLMSLPLVFKTDLSNMPPPLALESEPERVQAWRALLGDKGQRLRVGLVWRGNAAHVDDRKRSMALKDLLPLLSDDIDWVSLHKTLPPEDEALLAQHPHVRHFGAQQQDFGDAAAMLSLLDLVITVDTSMAHLAGSMGRPVWILLAFNADWRWLRDRDDSPWYPSARLLRQPASGDWAGVLAQARQALAGLKTAAG